MKKTSGARSPRPYPAHFYRPRRGLVGISGLCAVVLTILSVAMLATGEAHGYSVALLALPFWIFLTLVLSRKKRVYLCVDREGVELSSYLGVFRCDWSEIDDIWMTKSPAGDGKDAVAVRLRDFTLTRILVADMWNDPVKTIYEHIVRYRMRYGKESGAVAEGTQAPDSQR